MFSLVSGLYSEYFSPQQINLLVVGVQGSGKTTVLERIKVTNFPSRSVPGRVGLPVATGITSNLNHDRDGYGLSPKNAATHGHGHGAGPTTTPELLRSKIFVSDSPHNYEAPRPFKSSGSRSRRRSQQQQQQQQPPRSKFSWICPAPPKYRLARLDTSDREFSDDLHEYSDDGLHLDLGMDLDLDHEREHEHVFFSNDDSSNDDSGSSATEAMSLKEQSRPLTRSIVMRRTNSNPNLLQGGSGSSSLHQHQHHHRNTHNKAFLSVTTHGGGPIGLPAPRRISDRTASVAAEDLRRSSMESIDLGRKPQRRRSASSHEQLPILLSPSAPNYNREEQQRQQQNAAIQQHQFDLKPGAKMLPLDKIRPTIGMNLAKMDICGTKVHVWDLGGKLQDLWERYYADADAVLFVWKLSREDAQLRQQQQQRQRGDFADGDDDDDDDSDVDDSVRAFVTAELQKKVLEQVRSAVPDDVPFCVLGHLFQSQPPYNCEPDVLYSTSQLLPHYHNPNQSLFLVNAVSGQGMKTAMEWLISAAKRQQRIRERSAEANLSKH